MNNLPNRTLDILTTTSTKYYTAPTDGTATVCLIQAANKNLYGGSLNNEVTIMVSSSDGLFYLAKNMVVGSRSSITPLSGELILSPGDQIWAYASQSDGTQDIELVMSMIERSDSGNYSTTYSFINGSLQLTAPYNNIYTVPSGKRVIVTLLQASNITGESQSIDIRIKPAGTARSLGYGIEIPPSSSIDVITGRLVLLQDDIVQGAAINANVVDVVVAGVLFNDYIVIE